MATQLLADFSRSQNSGRAFMRMPIPIPALATVRMDDWLRPNRHQLQAGEEGRLDHRGTCGRTICVLFY